MYVLVLTRGSELEAMTPDSTPESTQLLSEMAQVQMMSHEYGAWKQRHAHKDTCSRKPSSCSCGDAVENLWEIAPVSTPLTPRTGKWMLFPGSVELADDLFTRLSDATKSGALGFALKVSFTIRARPGILVFVADDASEKDRVEQAIRDCAGDLLNRGNLKLGFKLDMDTQRGKYSHGYFIFQQHPGSHGLFEWAKCVETFRAEKKFLLPPEHPDGSPAAEAVALVGASRLRAAVSQELIDRLIDDFAAKKLDSRTLEPRTNSAVDKTLLSDAAFDILFPHLKVLERADLRTHDVRRDVVVAAVVYYVHAAHGENPIRDLAQHLIVLADEIAEDFVELLKQHGGCIEKPASARRDPAVRSFTATATLAGVRFSQPGSSKLKAEIAAARCLLHAIGLPHSKRDTDEVPSFDLSSYAGSAGYDFKGLLLDLNGVLHDDGVSSPTPGWHIATARVLGVTRVGTPMPSKELAEAAAAAAALCGAALITPVEAASVFRLAPSTGAAAGGSADGGSTSTSLDPVPAAAGAGAASRADGGSMDPTLQPPSIDSDKLLAAFDFPKS